MFIGDISGYNFTTGTRNCLVGRRTGGSTRSSSSYNTMVGQEAGAQGEGDISHNTLVGYYAGKESEGDHNTCIGSQAGDNIEGGDNNIVIGKDADASSSTVDNEITLGNSSISALRCQVTSISSLSDRRDKTDINTLDLGLDFVNSLKPVKFKWDSREGIAKDGTYEAGFIAQDFQQVQKDNDADYLNLVLESNPEKLEAAPGKLIPILVKAIQELKQEIELLKTP